MKKSLGWALLAAICFVFALAAKADDIHLCAAGRTATRAA
jgi:hypothetical protein